jgi:hypothetical protein
MNGMRTPDVQVTLKTVLSCGEVVHRLSHAIEKHPPLVPFQPRPTHWIFAGSITHDSFSLCRIPAGKRIYEHQLDGVITTTDTGAIITITIRSHPASRFMSIFAISMGLCFGIGVVGVPLYFTVANLLPLSCGLFPLAVALFFGLLIRATISEQPTLSLDAITALEHIKTLLQAELVQEDTHGSVSGEAHNDR